MFGAYIVAGGSNSNAYCHNNNVCRDDNSVIVHSSLFTNGVFEGTNGSTHNNNTTFCGMSTCVAGAIFENGLN